MKENILDEDRVGAVCPVFGQCGGCQYQDISYQRELALKQDYLQKLFFNEGFAPESITPIVPSPAMYHYRSRLDMRFLKTRDGWGSALHSGPFSRPWQSQPPRVSPVLYSACCSPAELPVFSFFSSSGENFLQQTAVLS